MLYKMKHSIYGQKSMIFKGHQLLQLHTSVTSKAL